MVNFDARNEFDNMAEVQIDSDDADVLVKLGERDDVRNHVDVDILVLVGEQPCGFPDLGGLVIPANVLRIAGVVFRKVGRGHVLEFAGFRIFRDEKPGGGGRKFRIVPQVSRGCVLDVAQRGHDVVVDFFCNLVAGFLLLEGFYRGDVAEDGCCDAVCEMLDIGKEGNNLVLFNNEPVLEEFLRTLLQNVAGEIKCQPSQREGTEDQAGQRQPEYFPVNRYSHVFSLLSLSSHFDDLLVASAPQHDFNIPLVDFEVICNKFADGFVGRPVYGWGLDIHLETSVGQGRDAVTFAPRMDLDVDAHGPIFPPMPKRSRSIRWWAPSETWLPARVGRFP